jgi:hypothetical protein
MYVRARLIGRVLSESTCTSLHACAYVQIRLIRSTSSICIASGSVLGNGEEERGGGQGGGGGSGQGKKEPLKKQGGPRACDACMQLIVAMQTVSPAADASGRVPTSRRCRFG